LRKPLAEILKIGLPGNILSGFGAGVAARGRGSVAEYCRLGAKTMEISLPNPDSASRVYYVIAPGRIPASSRYDGVRYGYRHAAYADLTDMYEKTAPRALARR